MKANHLIILSAYLLLVFSCKKENQVDYTNVEFEATSIAKDGRLKVFTEKGRLISDLNEIKNFINDNTLLQGYELNVSNGESVKFISPDSVYFLNSSGITFKRFAYKIEGSNISFYETYPVRIEAKSSIYDEMVRFKPIFSEQYVVTGLGGAVVYTKRTNTIRGYISKNELKLNQFSFKLFKAQSDAYWQTYNGSQMNVFDENYLKTLTSRDTLAVQAHTMNFKRIN